MNKITWKIFSFILLLVTVLPLLHIPAIHLKQKKISRVMEDKLISGVLHTITLDKKEVHWIKPGKEIMFNGRMFDVKSVSIQNNTITLSGLFDDDETVLMEQVRKDHENNSASHKQLAQLFQLLQALYDNSSAEEMLFSTVVLKDYGSTRVSSLLSPFISGFTPPPQA